jgi:hypothetical protein
MASDDRRQGGNDISDEVLSSSSQIYSKEKMLKEARKESVTEELYYVRNEGFLGNAIVVDKRL